MLSERAGGLDKVWETYKMTSARRPEARQQLRQVPKVTVAGDTPGVKPSGEDTGGWHSQDMA